MVVRKYTLICKSYALTVIILLKALFNKLVQSYNIEYMACFDMLNASSKKIKVITLTHIIDEEHRVSSVSYGC